MLGWRLAASGQEGREGAGCKGAGENCACHGLAVQARLTQPCHPCHAWWLRRSALWGWIGLRGVSCLTLGARRGGPDGCLRNGGGGCGWRVAGGFCRTMNTGGHGESVPHPSAALKGGAPGATGSCRPFRGSGAGLSTTRGSRPWLRSVAPFGAAAAYCLAIVAAVRNRVGTGFERFQPVLAGKMPAPPMMQDARRTDDVRCPPHPLMPNPEP